VKPGRDRHGNVDVHNHALPDDVESAMKNTHLRRFVTPLVIVLAAAAASTVSAQSPKQNTADVERVIQALDIRPGSFVGEVGAGDGALTVAIAGAVGEAGRVFTNELNADRVAAIGSAVEKAGLKQVTIVRAETTSTGFPDQCCDGIFMRDVYHHFTNPAAMNASLMKSLRPGGRLAVLDFGPPPGAESADPAGRGEDGHHGITAPTLERELKAAGFEVLSTTPYGFRAIIVVARRPVGECPDQ
jgi:ubiquinone/menaquinone biosynthesis C-methylase UbiE